ncbi:MAG: hypothetical protein K2X35_02690 [Bryobacteraceae bacterium]|nr:hypothetical protein [Bryobacteraceae bacterium]
MRCLYCGKELALFRKWTGSSEFCSEEHQQRHHEEFNRLALSRLLQAPGAASLAGPPATPQLAAVTAHETPNADWRNGSEIAAPRQIEAANAPSPAAGFIPQPLIQPVDGESGRTIARSIGAHRDFPVPEFRIGVTSAGPILSERPSMKQQELEGSREPIDVPLEGGFSNLSADAWQFPFTQFRPGIEMRETMRLNLKTSGLGLEPEDVERPSAGLLSVDLSVLGHSIERSKVEVEPAEPDHEEEPGADPPIEIPSLWEVGEPEPAVAIPAAEETAPEAAPPVPLVAGAEPVNPVAAMPSRVKAGAVFHALPMTSAGIQMPRLSGLPLRPMMVLGPAPAPPAPPEPAAAAPAPAPAATPEPKAAEPENKENAGRLSRKERARAKSRPADARTAEPKPREAEESKPAPPEAGKQAPPEKPEPRAAEPEKQAEPAKPEPPPAQTPKPLSDADIPSFGGPRLGAAAAMDRGMPTGVRVAAALGGIVVLAGLAYLGFSGDSKPARGGAVELREGPALPISEGSWSTDWGGGSAQRKERITVYRPSLSLSDYRYEFQAEIPGRSLGWVFRAADPKNYYVGRLDIQKRGLNPTVVLIRYAVIDGQESAHTQLPLTMPVRIDTAYKVKVEAVGNKFTISILGKVLDQWTDDRLRTGGVGLIQERGERPPQPRGVHVTPLILGNR